MNKTKLAVFCLAILAIAAQRKVGAIQEKQPVQGYGVNQQRQAALNKGQQERQNAKHLDRNAKKQQEQPMKTMKKETKEGTPGMQRRQARRDMRLGRRTGNNGLTANNASMAARQAAIK